MKKQILSFLLATTMVSNLCGGLAYATTQTNQVSETNNIDFSKITPYIVSDSNGMLSVDESVKDDFGIETYESVNSQLQETNKLISDGYITLNENLDVAYTNKILEETKDANIIIYQNTIIDASSMMRRTVSGGVNKIETYWWGTEVYLNNDTCQKISKSGTVVGLTSIIAGIFGTPVAGAMVGGILGVGILTVVWANNGNGVILTSNRFLAGIPGASLAFTILSVKSQ